MSEKKEIQLNVKLDEDTKSILETISKKTALKEQECLRQLIRLCAEFDFFDKDWKNKIIEAELDTYAKKEQIRLKSDLTLSDLQEASKDKDRKLNVKLKLLTEYLKTRTESEKREFFDREFHEKLSFRGEEVKALPNKLKDNTIEVYINGKRLIVKELLGDYPKLDFNQERLVKCECGFHTKGSFCYECEKVRDCFTIRNEQLEGIKL
jgi:hypothetical protein